MEAGANECLLMDGRGIIEMISRSFWTRMGLGLRRLWSYYEGIWGSLYKHQGHGCKIIIDEG